MPVGIEHLESHGISRRVIGVWKNSGIETLLPLQQEAVARSSLLQGGSLVVFAPTSSGKTFIAEIAALRHMEENRRVVYLVPTKALAEEKYSRFQRLYHSLGYRILAATRERPESDPLALNGSFDILVAVYEKMKSYLVQRPTLLSQVGLVVADEVQMLGERERGRVVDLLLTKVANSPYQVQFLGLSAVLGDVIGIARWLDCSFLKETRRPVELREGIFDAATGRFFYREFNTGVEGTENLAPGSVDDESGEEGDYLGFLFELARILVMERRDQVLIFVPTRRLSRSLAEKLAASLEIEPANEALSRMERYEESHSRSSLMQCLESGVAYHNADLSFALRRLIEEHYNRGAIRILVSTSTLGEGVNLTGKNVIQCPEMIRRDDWTGQCDVVPITRARFRNQGGRAGRLGLESDFGRSMLVASGGEQVERMMREYIYGELEPLSPPIRDEQIAPAILDLVSSGLCRDHKSLMDFLSKTYTGLIKWNGWDDFSRILQEQIDGCRRKHFLRDAGSNQLEATGAGEVTAASGIRLETASLFLEWLDRQKGPIPGAFEVLFVTAFSPDAADFPVPMNRMERRNLDFPQTVEELVGRDRIEAVPLLSSLVERPGGYTDSDFRALKKALILHDWIGTADTLSIEDRFGILAGIIKRLAEHFSWLVQSCAALAEILGSGGTMAEHLSRMALRLRLGLGEEGLALAKLHLEGLERSHLQALVREGFDTPGALFEAPRDLLQKILPPTAVDAILLQNEKENIPGGENATGEISREPNQEEKPVEPFLILPLSEPGIAICAGKRVRLTPLPYRLLLTLARRPGSLVTYLTIDEEVWPEQKVERQQVSFHRATLLKSIGKAAGKERVENLIRTYSGQGLELNLAPEDIRII